jgi:phosphate-selective porin OprO/OprP
MNSPHNESSGLACTKELIRIFMKIPRAILAASLMLSSIAFADKEKSSLLEILKANGTINGAQYQQLLTEQSNTQLKKTSAETSSISADANSGLKIVSADKQFSAQLGGRIEVHGAVYNDDGVNMGDGTSLRRARLNINGTLYGDWRYKFEYDFADGDLKGFKDAYLSYTAKRGVEYIVGNFRVPYSLEALANAHANTFMERSLGFAFKPGWHLGSGVNLSGTNWTWNSGVFGDSADQNAAGEDGEWIVGSRITWLPYYADDSFVHLGAAGLFGDRGDHPSMRYKSGPESNVTSVSLVDTQAISGIDSYSQLGFEAALSLKRFNFQAEYMLADLERAEGELMFNGWYVQSSYFLTADSRSYKKGRYVPVKPQSILGRNGSGAWELALRLSGVDLSDADVRGGQQQDLALALNVYATQQVRFSAEYVNVLSNSSPKTAEPELFQLRAEWVL